MSYLPSLDYPLQAARGLTDGVSIERKFGRNPNIGTSDEVIASSGLANPYTPTIATTIEAISTSANDTAAGSGARTIIVEGLDASFNEITATITMNGTSATTATTSSFIRVNRVYVATSGTYQGNNAGDITVRVSGAGATIGLILTGLGQNLNSHYCVPNGYDIYLTEIHLSSEANKQMSFTFWQVQDANDVTVPFTGKRALQRYDAVSNVVNLDYSTAPVRIPSKSDIWVSGVLSSGTGAGSAEYIFYKVAL